MKLWTCFLPELGSDLQVAMFATKRVPITIMIAPLKRTPPAQLKPGGQGGKA